MKRFTCTMAIGLLFLAACDTDIITPPGPPQLSLDAQLRQSIGQWGVVPIGPMPAQDAAQVVLGRALFFDRILSGNRDIACATCHRPEASLTDGLSLAIGTGGTGIGETRALGAGREFVPRSAPTLLNAGLGAFYMFWDGRLTGFGSGPFITSPDTALLFGVRNLLAAQALLPVLNRREMRGEPGDRDVFGNVNELAAFDDAEREEIWNAVMQRLLAIPEYEQMFEAAFPSTPTSQLRFKQAADALAAFQMEEFTKTRSPFDRYLDRDDAALTTEQKRGGLLFFGEAQCSSCHNGPFLGAQDFANVGAPQIGPGVGNELPLDLGRAAIDNFEFYRFAFRVAPLRNVALTAPYMHSGAYPTLEAVVGHYSNIPEALAEYDVNQIAPPLRDYHHGDNATIDAVLSNLDFRLQRPPLDFSETETNQLVAFLKSLTDPAARDLMSIVPASVPSGLPVQE